ncbi:nicotinamide-nucleotide amidohydrolase family protein [uncultured Corynebacterium sp.]|uniref:nicotinamide-nucleotide amidohydrolase family protein n=1 Tax=uncultured Corynebacterium sp. TaxID=159447 RepID=UPI0025CC5CDD|nr:nicotinamide-nucleotide amidohydrolase family protein [uncultured Corynebacterium sp.]
MSSGAPELLTLLAARGDTLGTCESVTAGLAAASLADVPGASAVLRGGLITYATAVKAHFTHVPLERLEAQGVVSEYTALKMAQAACDETDADWGLSFTGVAGPDMQEDKLAGTVYIGVASRVYDVAEAYAAQGLEGSRNEIRRGAVEQGFALLTSYIEDNSPQREQPDIVVRWTK